MQKIKKIRSNFQIFDTKIYIEKHWFNSVSQFIELERNSLWLYKNRLRKIFRRITEYFYFFFIAANKKYSTT